MLERLIKRVHDEEEGFTLIELMVVVLIIAILIAIAIPTFLGARERAQNRAAQSNVRNALTAEKTHYTDAQAYTEDATTLNGIEKSLTFTADAAPTGGTNIGVSTADSDATVMLGGKSASGKCYWVKDATTGSAGTQYLTQSTCAVPTTGDAGWTTKW